MTDPMHPSNGPRRPFLWRHQGLAILITMLVVAGGVGSTHVRTNLARNVPPIDIETLVPLIIVALPALTLPFVTRRTQVWPVVSLLSIGGWVLFLGPAGDTSCVDCGFLLMIPISAEGIQLLLAVLVFVFPSMRRSPYR